MKSKPTGIESIAIRRAVIADSDKVRYRVYSSPTELRFKFIREQTELYGDKFREALDV